MANIFEKLSNRITDRVDKFYDTIDDKISRIENFMNTAEESSDTDTPHISNITDTINDIPIETKGLVLTCPACTAELTVDEDREFIFCSYCGHRILIEQNIYAHQYRMRKLELEAEKEKRGFEAALKKEKEDDRQFLIFFPIMIGIPALLLLALIYLIGPV